MPRNEDGEYELILRNRQVMSVFFMVAVLVVVFFTMGYIVGRNSAPQAGEAIQVTRAEPSTAAPAARTTEPAPAESSAGTAVQRPAERPAELAAEPVRETRPETSVPDSARTETPVPSKRARAAAQPVPGKAYLQLAATSEHEAGVLVDVLRKKGFKALLAEIEEKPGTFRVLVGPVDDGTTNKMRAQLQDSGFPGNAAIRRTF